MVFYIKILNFGSCNIDFVYSVEHIVKPGETLSSLSMNKFVGGKGLNQSVALANAGSEVYHAGYIGSDGEMLRTFLQSCGADVTYLKTVTESSGHAIILVAESGENSIVIHSGANSCITREYIDRVLSDFEADDILVLQNEISNVDYIISKAHDIGMKTFFNPAPFTDGVLKIDLEKIYCLIANEIEAKNLTSAKETEDSIDHFIKHYPSLKTVITLGEKGSVYIEDGNITKQSAFKADVVDTTAAGDTFVGYFVSCLSRGLSPSEALRTASLASAITVSRHGAAPSIPTIQEVTSSKLVLSTNNKKEQVISYFNERYVTASLEELASSVGYSTAYTARWIKNAFGKSFSVLLKEKRCEIAAYLLKNCDDKIGDVAEKVGYANESFFRKAFAEIYGENPSSFRKNFRKQAGL